LGRTAGGYIIPWLPGRSGWLDASTAAGTGHDRLDTTTAASSCPMQSGSLCGSSVFQTERRVCSCRGDIWHGSGTHNLYEAAVAGPGASSSGGRPPHPEGRNPNTRADPQMGHTRSNTLSQGGVGRARPFYRDKEGRCLTVARPRVGVATAFEYGRTWKFTQDEGGLGEWEI